MSTVLATFLLITVTTTLVKSQNFGGSYYRPYNYYNSWERSDRNYPADEMNSRSNNDFSDESCNTPDGERGTCVNIRRCDQLLQLLRRSSNDPRVIAFLRNSQCGRDEQGPLVCCPQAQNDQPDIRDNDGTNDFPAHVPSPPQCGFTDVSHTRIVGGSPSNLGAWPWLVVYGYRNRRLPNSELQWLCGGALVTEKHTITAAHCTQHPSLTMFVARLGELHLDPNVDDSANPVDIPVTRAIKHPQYRQFTNDIAIVVLQKPVTYNKYIQPICLPFGGDMKRDSFVNKNPFIAGWGAQQFKGASSKMLLEAQVQVVPNEGCANSYRTVNAIISERQLCAGTQGAKPKDACQGDSGGPLMLPRDGRFYLVGVVSYGYRCATPGFPGIYTRITEYLDWISDSLSR